MSTADKQGGETDARAEAQGACPDCGGTGNRDSGGVMPWGEPAMVPCGCEAAPTTLDVLWHLIDEFVSERCAEIMEAAMWDSTADSGPASRRLDEMLRTVVAQPAPQGERAPELPDPHGCRACVHPDCARFDGPRQVECRAMEIDSCARQYGTVVAQAVAAAQPASQPTPEQTAALDRMADNARDLGLDYEDGAPVQAGPSDRVTLTWSTGQDDPRVNEIVSGLYRRFKAWHERGFGADEVTWCEVKADVIALLARYGSQPADPCPGCRPGCVCNRPDCGRIRSSELMRLYGSQPAASQDAQARDAWIPTSERLPDPHKDLLLTLSTGAVVVGGTGGTGIWDWPDTDDEADEDAHVTHWRELPAPPAIAADATPGAAA